MADPDVEWGLIIGCTPEGLGADLSALDSKPSVNALARFCVVEFEE